MVQSSSCNVLVLLFVSLSCFGLEAGEATTVPQHESLRFNEQDNSSQASVENLNENTAHNHSDTVHLKEGSYHLNVKDTDGSGFVQNDSSVLTKIQQQPKLNEPPTSAVVTQISTSNVSVAPQRKSFRTRSVSSEDRNRIISSSGVLLSVSTNASTEDHDLSATKRHKGRKMHGARHSSKNPKIRPKNLLGLGKSDYVNHEDSSSIENGIMAVSPRRFHNKTGHGINMEDEITLTFKELNPKLITFNKTASGVRPYTSVNAFQRPLQPTTEIVPLNDVTNPYDGSKADDMGKNRTLLPGDPKRPFFDIASIVELQRSNSSDGSSGEPGGEGAYGERDEGMYCFTCNSSTSSDYCYNMGDENGTLTGGEDYDIPPSRSCGPPAEGQFCMVSRVWFVTKDGANKTEHRFSIKRGCRQDCEPFYIMMGDRSKIEITASRTCCTTPNCNSGNTASRTCCCSYPLLAAAALMLWGLHR